MISLTNEQAIGMMKAKLKCMQRSVSGIDYECNNKLCDACCLNYDQGNMGEQKEWLRMGIKALENQKTGHWRFRKREGDECVYRCSNGGRKITKYDGFCDFERLFAYCPECGVKMEGENND